LQFFYYTDTLITAIHHVCSIDLQLLAALVLKFLFLFWLCAEEEGIISALQFPSWWSHNICRKIGCQRRNPQGMLAHTENKSSFHTMKNGAAPSENLYN
jgi:hypothetical protein